jgi:hypothetical protein
MKDHGIHSSTDEPVISHGRNICAQICGCTAQWGGVTPQEHVTEFCWLFSRTSNATTVCWGSVVA